MHSESSSLKKNYQFILKKYQGNKVFKLEENCNEKFYYVKTT